MSRDFEVAADDPRGEYGADARLRGLKPGSIRIGMMRFESLERHAGVAPHLATKSQIRDWLATSPTPGGSAFNLRTVKPFFKWLIAEGIRTDDPTFGIRVKAPDEPQNTATEAQVEKMLKRSRSKPRDHAIITILVCTGCRRSELGLATFGDARRFIHSSSILLKNSKSQPRVVPLDPAAEKALRRWLRDNHHRGDDEPLWLTKWGPEQVARAVYRYSGNALSPHTLRRYVVGKWLMGGGSTVSLGRLCGWSPGTAAQMASTYSRGNIDDVLMADFRRINKM